MDQVRLGSTGIMANRNGFGALPMQRIDRESAVRLVRKAYRHGITFFDTARVYTDSESKLADALGDVRAHVTIASKTMATDAEGFWKDLHASLRELRTDAIDLYQFHNPPFCPGPGGADGLYDAMLQARAQGKVRHIGITNHRLAVAWEAIRSGLYETLQFPFSYLASEKELELVHACEEANMGFIAMKALSGGLITNAAAAYAYIAQFPGVLPIWGMQREEELDAFLATIVHPPAMSDDIRALIDRDRAALSGHFCRGCGYCMPCPAGIEIHTCARVSLLLRRSPSAQWLSERNRAMMRKIEDCIHCGQCETRCPYGLKTRTLLAENYRDYQEVLAGKPL